MIDLENLKFRPPLTGPRVAPGAGGSICRDDIQTRETTRQSMEKGRKCTCNNLLIGAPKRLLDWLQHVL